MKKKIVIISETMSGGVRRHLVDLLMNLDIDKFDIYFVYGTERIDTIMKSMLIDIKQRGIKLIEVEELKRSIGLDDIRALKRIYNLLINIEPDVVHCHSSKAGAIGRIACKIAKINKVYYTPHAYIFQDPQIKYFKKKIYIYIEKLLSRIATNKTINVSYGELQIALDNRIDKFKKFEVIYNGINENIKTDKIMIEYIRKNLKLDDKDRIVGNIARLDKQKNPYIFIDIALKICKKNKHIKFIYIGDGELLDEIKEKVKSKNMQENIKILGFRDDTDIMLEVFDIFLSTSLYESMPYSLIEACRVGLPIIATDIVGHNEIVENNKNGYLFDLNNLEQASRYILDILENKDLEKNLSFMSKVKFNNKFTLSNMIEKYQSLYLK